VELEVVPGLEQLPAAGARCLTNSTRIKEQCCGSGIQCFYDPWIRDGKNQDPGSGIKHLGHICGSLVTNFWVKILKFCVADPDPGWKNPDAGSGMGKPKSHWFFRTKFCGNTHDACPKPKASKFVYY
jgi:hypothetical protein